MIYLYQVGSININIEEEEAYPFSIIAVFALISIYMMISFRKKVKPASEERYE
jgi:hypothetical protein